MTNRTERTQAKMKEIATYVAEHHSRKAAMAHFNISGAWASAAMKEYGVKLKPSFTLEEKRKLIELRDEKKLAYYNIGFLMGISESAASNNYHRWKANELA